MIEDDEIPKYRSKKNTKKWCKGKVGVEHKTKWVKGSELKNTNNRLKDILIRKPSVNRFVLICEVCGKELDWDWNNEHKEM